MTRERRLALSCCAFAVLALPVAALAQGIRAGSEFQVNAYTPGNQQSPAVAASAAGDFVVCWQSNPQDGDSAGVFARRFSSAGTPVASEFQVNTVTSSAQRYPSIASDADGDFVVAWESYQDGASLGVFARRFSSTGTAIASEFQVNAFTASSQRFPAVAAKGNGDFVVAWESYGQDGSFDGVFARRFSSAGTALAAEFQVNTYTTEHQSSAAVAVSATGNFVVAWVSQGQDGSSVGVFARSFSSTGTPLAAEFQVNTYTSDGQRYPVVALAADGDFVVAWGSNGQDGASFGIFARGFSSAGAPLASEFQVNTNTSSNQTEPTLSALAGGGFVVAWASLQDGSGFGVFARGLSSAGVAVGGELQLNTYTTGNQYLPSLAAQASGDFVVAWTDGNRDGGSYGVFAQRFAALAALDVDGNGALGPLTDGLLVLRFAFGFTGTTLTNGAVGVNCTRCDAAAITPYLTGLGLVLDVDGNGAVAPLTDGLLVLRFLFGFTGTTLTSGAVGGSCARCDATTIGPYLAGLTQ